MPKQAPTPKAAAAAEAAKNTAAATSVVCTVLKNRTLIGKAVCAAGKRIRLEIQEAKTLEAAGLVRIDGI
jgi:AAA+ superfamily predicted ATPase